jgi:hypothetical protein
MTRSLRRRLWLPVLALALVVPACMDTRQLDDDLTRDYGPVDINYPTSDQRVLRVTFLSSPFAERGDAERRVTARKVAEYVRDHYPRYKALDKVRVGFQTKKETAADTLYQATAAASYTFTRAELGPPGP